MQAHRRLLDFCLIFQDHFVKKRIPLKYLCWWKAAAKGLWMYTPPVFHATIKSYPGVLLASKIRHATRMTLLWNPLTTDDALVGSQERNIAYMIAHCGFFMFNVLNVSYILLFEGFAFGRLGQNSLLKIAFFGCLFQICSCLASIYRYNINDEFGIYAHLGTVFSLIAFSLSNSAYLSVLFQDDSRPGKIRVGTLVWALIAIGCLVITEKNWEEDDFKYFRVYIAASVLYQTVALILGHRALAAATTNQANDTATTLTKVFKVLIVLDTGCLVFTGLAGLPIVSYPATGLTFTVMVFAMSFVGRSKAAFGRTETESLLV